MVKCSVDLRSDSIEQLNVLVQRWWPSKVISSFQILRGGYSGTNYKILTTEGDLAVLKVCNGYTRQQIEEQAQCTAYLNKNGFGDRCCFPFPLSESSNQYVALTHDEEPSILINFIIGKAADYVLEQRVVSVDIILFNVGHGLAALHNVPLDESNCLRSFVDGGACFAGLHLKGYFLNLFHNHSESFVTEHPFVAIYDDRNYSLVHDITNSELPVGILHGDPFLDNVLLDESTGALR